jgi:hypothetical protein
MFCGSATLGDFLDALRPIKSKKKQLILINIGGLSATYMGYEKWVKLSLYLNDKNALEPTKKSNKNIKSDIFKRHDRSTTEIQI